MQPLPLLINAITMSHQCTEAVMQQLYVCLLVFGGETDSSRSDWILGGSICVCEPVWVTKGTNATLLEGQRCSEVHSLLILLSIAVAAGDTHYCEYDERHHSVL